MENDAYQLARPNGFRDDLISSSYGRVVPLPGLPLFCIQELWRIIVEGIYYADALHKP